MSENHRFNCMKVSLVFVFMLFFQLAHAQYDFGGLDKKIETARKELGGHVVVMIYKDNKIIYQKSLGEEFNPKTQAPIASCSKWLTAALVMTYVDEGKLSLDDPIGKYLPVFKQYNKGYITLRHCLAHLTGIESDAGRPLKAIFERRKYKSLEEEVNDFASKKEITANAGLEFSYSNVGLNIAGRILEVITRRSFEQLMQERITRPLMMRNTSFSGINAVNPSGGAVSTAADYMNFLAMILNKGVFNGKRILSEKAIADMQTAQTTPSMIRYAPKAAQGYNYGLGEWVLATDENGKTTVVASPGLFGTWPMIDNCRGYACLFFTKGLLGEEKRDLYLDMKAVIDAQIASNCK